MAKTGEMCGVCQAEMAEVTLLGGDAATILGAPPVGAGPDATVLASAPLGADADATILVASDRRRPTPPF